MQPNDVSTPNALHPNARQRRRSPRATCLRRRPARRGLVLLEMLIGATLVLAMLSIAAPTVIRSARIWKQTRQFQVACDELAAQMDRLVAMPADSRAAALDSLQVSSDLEWVLHEAKISGGFVEDEDGKRIELSIDWERIGETRPVTLVAWIDALPESAAADEDDTQSEIEEDSGSEDSGSEETNNDSEDDQ